MTGDEDLLHANANFYAAFARRDLSAMEEVWSTEVDAVCIHPGWPPIRGRREILASWRSIFEHDDGPLATSEGGTAHVLGDAGFVVCRERVGGVVLIATNVFVREGSAWKMVHHHASRVARVPETPAMDPEHMPN